MRIVVLAGGVGGARFLQGVRTWAQSVADPAGDLPAEITAIVNTGDDVTLHGLRICPDLDSVMYTLGNGIDPVRGWGREAETWTVKEELAAYGADPDWFGLGDRDVATHLIRTRMLAAGYPLSAVTEALCARWQPGVRLLPMSDDRVETHVVVSAEAAPGEVPGQPSGQGLRQAPGPGPGSGPGSAPSAAPPQRRAMHFQEWWIRHRAALPAERFVLVGIEDAKPAPGVLEAIAAADLVLVAPSNPVVSIGTTLAVPGIRDALTATSAKVVGVSPIIGGAPVRGMAERCLPAIGVEVSAGGVATHYGARAYGGLLDGWLVDTTDAGAALLGATVRAIPLWMTDPPTTAQIVAAAVDLAGLPTSGVRP
jgi:LPPG:FO 2-phospho-L-lactate transferase